MQHASTERPVLLVAISITVDPAQVGMILQSAEEIIIHSLCSPAKNVPHKK